MPISAGTTLGRYEIRSLLGVGGMGEVYLAHDTQMRRLVALKFLPETLTRDDDRLRRFEQEAYAASGLNHPNILTIYEIGEIEQRRFIAMEYIEGETLRHHIAHALSTTSEGPHGSGMKLGHALDIAIQIASALSRRWRRSLWEPLPRSPVCLMPIAEPAVCPTPTMDRTCTKVRPE